ncbi:hypothetical protein GCAAIG_00750 [Candidatus Electronema halotolerans]
MFMICWSSYTILDSEHQIIINKLFDNIDRNIRSKRVSIPIHSEKNIKETLLQFLRSQIVDQPFEDFIMIIFFSKERGHFTNKSTCSVGVNIEKASRLSHPAEFPQTLQHISRMMQDTAAMDKVKGTVSKRYVENIASTQVIAAFRKFLQHLRCCFIYTGIKIKGIDFFCLHLKHGIDSICV